MVRVNTRGGEQMSRMTPGQGKRFVATRTIAARYDHLDHTGLGGSCNNGITITVKAVMSEVDADIDQIATVIDPGTGYHR
jgi:hypothetical protein